MRERVTIERRGEISDDGMGNYIGEWATLIDERRARIAPTRGGEEVIAARLEGVQRFDIWLRADPDTLAIKADDRVIDLNDASRVFAIRYVGNLDERRRFILLQCEAGVAA